MNKFTKAIVRRPCSNIIEGLSNNNFEKPNYKLAFLSF